MKTSNVLSLVKLYVDIPRYPLLKERMAKDDFTDFANELVSL